MFPLLPLKYSCFCFMYIILSFSFFFLIGYRLKSPLIFFLFILRDSLFVIDWLVFQLSFKSETFSNWGNLGCSSIFENVALQSYLQVQTSRLPELERRTQVSLKGLQMPASLQDIIHVLPLVVSFFHSSLS